MKVAVTVTVDVDQGKYEAEYGESTTPDAIREDIEFRVREATEVVLKPFDFAKLLDAKAKLDHPRSAIEARTGRSVEELM